LSSLGSTYSHLPKLTLWEGYVYIYASNYTYVCIYMYMYIYICICTSLLGSTYSHLPKLTLWEESQAAIEDCDMAFCCLPHGTTQVHMYIYIYICICIYMCIFNGKYVSR
jgi:hypothetical protein